MKIVLTGSIGNISKPLAQELIQKGHSITVITRKEERKKEIETLGAIPAIGHVEDVAFVSSVFAGADAVYLMESTGPDSFFNQQFDLMEATREVGLSFKQAIINSGVKRVVHLSSIGAHTNVNNGILAFHYQVEQLLKELPAEVSITFMRPVAFYYNLLAFIPTIKSQGVIVSNYGGDTPKPWVSPFDIASAIAEEITLPMVGRKIRYVVSEEISCNEIARILGNAIGKPELKWMVISDDQMLQGMLSLGMNPQIAKGFTEMNAAIQDDSLFIDYQQNRPVPGNIKMKDYALDFARIYQQQMP